ncbi:hypothetical protein D3C76_1700950 [compost metagenome]
MRQGLNLPAGHDEIIGTFILYHRAVDLPGGYLKRVRTITLIEPAGDEAGVHHYAVNAIAEDDIAVDGAGSIGREGQRVVAVGVGE